MSDIEILRIFRIGSVYLKHRDSCSNAPDYVADKRNCTCGLLKFHRMVMKKIVALEGQNV